MDAAKPSLGRRALAVVVLAVVVVVMVRLVVGAITAALWILALVALVVAALWALTTVKAAKRSRETRRAEASSARHLPTARPEDRVEAQIRQIKEQLRDQGRL